MPDTLFLTNCTTQRVGFYYRGLYLEANQAMTNAARRGVRPVDIREWEQNKRISVPDGALSTVIPQLVKFGFIAADQVNASAMRGMGVIVGVFSASPISKNARTTVIMHNNGVKTREGVDRRRNAAIANTEHLLDTLRQAGVDENRLPPAMVVEYEQDAESEQEHGGRLTEGVIVQAARAPTPQRGKGARVRKAA